MRDVPVEEPIKNDVVSRVESVEKVDEPVVVPSVELSSSPEVNAPSALVEPEKTVVSSPAIEVTFFLSYFHNLIIRKQNFQLRLLLICQFLLSIQPQ